MSNVDGMKCFDHDNCIFLTLRSNFTPISIQESIPKSKLVYARFYSIHHWFTLDLHLMDIRLLKGLDSMPPDKNSICKELGEPVVCLECQPLPEGVREYGIIHAGVAWGINIPLSDTKILLTDFGESFPPSSYYLATRILF
jgi:hypothetical protein